jgi:hypothetical protein
MLLSAFAIVGELLCGGIAELIAMCQWRTGASWNDCERAER